ncbi:MAG TPA: caspase family protein, partial [Pyrinomonadaceae bacterium]
RAAKNPADLLKVYNQQLAGALGGAGTANTIRVWDVTTGREVQAVAGPAYVRRLHFSDDGRRLVVVGTQGDITSWDVGSGARLQAYGGSPAGPLGGMMPGGGLTTGDMSAMTAMINSAMSAAATGGTGGKAVSVALSADGRTLAAGGSQTQSNFDASTLMSLGMRSGKMKREEYEKEIARTMQNVKVVSTGQVLLYDAATGQQTGVLASHGGGVEQVAFSRDGSLLATAATDNTIKVWDVAARREVRALAGHAANINSLAFSPDRRLLASAGDDGATLLWDLQTGELLATLVSLFDGGDWLVVTPDGLFDGSPRAWNQILWRYNGDTFEVAPIEWFFNEFYHPGLLSDIFNGKRPRAAADISKKDRRQPAVALTIEGARAQPPSSVTTRDVRVRIEVTDAKPDAENPQGSGARDVRLFRNGSLVRVWRGDVLKGQPSVVLETSVPVVAGENRLVAYAFNRDNVKSKDAPLALMGAESLKRAGTLYVLAVGVNVYANPQFNLKYAVADAREFGAEVERQQASLGRFRRTEVIPLLDGDATKANVLDALRRLSGASGPPTLKAGLAQTLERLQPAQPEDAVVIFFAGHGTADGQRFYLIPHDLGYDGSRTSIDDAGLRRMLAGSISDEELETAIEGLDAGQMLLVIDACNSGQALEAEEKRRGPMNSKGLAQLAYEKGMYILTAAESYQAALEAAQLGHGYLTYALVEEGLKKGNADAEPKDGTLFAREWLDYATLRVPLMQEEKMKQSRGLGVQIAFVEGEEKSPDPDKRSVQRPRVFYRRELETNPLVVAKPAAK